MNKTILILLSIVALGSCTEVNPDGRIYSKVNLNNIKLKE